jgi:hypothetical protein
MRKRQPTNARFSDDLVVAKPGEVVDPLVRVDRASPDYAAGAKARRAGRVRDARRSLSWVFGWDEAARRR